MKKRCLIIYLSLMTYAVVSAQLPTGYCASAAGQTDDEDITNVTLQNINNSSTCVSLTGSQGTGTGTASLYTDFTASNVPIPVLTPSGSFSLNATVTPCDGIQFTGAMKAWIDFNRDGDFVDANESFNIGSTTFSFTSTPTQFNNIAINVPTSISVGLTKMRVSFRETSLAALNPCDNTTFTWGETEDYVVFLGIKKWDYEIQSMTAPDSISFCGQDPVVIKATVKNVENQPIPGGRVDLTITGLNGSTTNLFYSKSFTQTVLQNKTQEIEFNPIQFPKDEMLKFTYVIYHPLDSNAGNDTLVKYVQVYKNPQYKLKGDTVCADTSNTAFIYDMPKPLFVKWTNESIKDTTSYFLPKTSYVGIQISRGWKCNVVDSVKLTVKPLPRLEVSPDTVLCNGQSVTLVVKSKDNLSGNFRWLANSIPVYTTSSSGQYLAAGTVDGCHDTAYTNVTIVYPPSQPKILDTICAGETATLGLDNNITGFLYKWKNRTETTPIIHPVSALSSGSEKYYVQWWYQGCTSNDSVSLFVNPIPNVTTTSNPPAICPFFSSTISVTGANTYLWKNGLGTSTSITVSPLTTTQYSVVGTDNKGCKKEVIHTQYVYPRPDMHVYSNKYMDNVCLGDSATVYVNGGKTYTWSTGSTDSIIKIIPTESFQWTMVGTDNNGCKDTVSYRLYVKPPLNITFDTDKKGCEGDIDTFTLHGAKSYIWGSLEEVTDSSFRTTLISSTTYQVTATSPYNCQIVVQVPVTVYKKPIPQLSDLTLCKGESGMLEAKGGIKYDWDTANSQSFLVANGNLAEFTGTSTRDVYVVVKNEAGCSDTAYTTVNVINTDSIEVIFKSPLDSYNCASPKIPISLAATPSGGVWSGSNVTGNKLSPAGLSGTVQVLYSFFEPINNCKVERVKNVKFKCTSGISNLEEYKDWSVYPNPFDRELVIDIESEKAEEAQIYIYDIAGREVYAHNQKISLGNNRITLPNLNLAKGTYYLDLQTESISRQTKIVSR